MFYICVYESSSCYIGVMVTSDNILLLRADAFFSVFLLFTLGLA